MMFDYNILKSSVFCHDWYYRVTYDGCYLYFKIYSFHLLIQIYKATLYDKGEKHFLVILYFRTIL